MVVITENEKYKVIINKLAEILTDKFNLPEKSYMELEFVSLEEIHEINMNTRGVDRPTDVLSFPNLEDIFGQTVEIKDFPFDIDPETNMLNLGSIVMCIDKIFQQAEEFGTGEMREFSYLLTHGMLHILGYDHMEEEDKVVMRAKEEELLEEIKCINSEK